MDFLIARTTSPILSLSLLPNSAGFSLVFGLILRSARSVFLSIPTTFAL